MRLATSLHLLNASPSKPVGRRFKLFSCKLPSPWLPAVGGRTATHTCYAKEMKNEMEKQSKMLTGGNAIPSGPLITPGSTPAILHPFLTLACAGKLHARSMGRLMLEEHMWPGLGTGALANGQFCMTKSKKSFSEQRFGETVMLHFVPQSL